MVCIKIVLKGKKELIELRLSGEMVDSQRIGCLKDVLKVLSFEFGPLRLLEF